MAWFKGYENAVTDAKIQCVAKISGQPVAFVIAVWAMILERASAADIRGDIDGFDCESADAALQMPDGAACAIFKALECKGMIDGHRIVNWDKRQAVRKKANGETGTAPKSNAERQREYRERQKAAKEPEADSAVTERNENVTLHNVTRNDVTQRNVTSNERCNEVTKSNAPLKDKIRLDKNIKIQESIKACAEPSFDSTTPLHEPPQSQSASLSAEKEYGKKPDPCVIELPIVGDREIKAIKVFSSDVETWRELYPGVDVEQELRNMRGWLIANPSRRKTKSGVPKFIVNWLSKEQNNSRNSRASPASQPKTFADLDEERFQRSMAKARAEDEARAQMEKSA